MQRVASRLRAATKRTLNVTTYAYDGFNRADGALGTSDSGHVWTNAGGSTFVISSGAVRVNANADGTYGYVTLTAGVNDVVVAADYTSNAGEQGGLIARATGTGTFYLLNIAQTGSIVLYRTVSGAYTSIGTGGAGTVPTTGTHTVGLSCKGSAIKALVDGSAVITVTDSGVASGTGAGFRHGNGTPNYRWDNFQVTPS